MVSLREGFGGPVVLLEKPIPGLAATTVSGFLGEFGLSGAFSSNLCCVASRPVDILFWLAHYLQPEPMGKLTPRLLPAKFEQRPSMLISCSPSLRD